MSSSNRRGGRGGRGIRGGENHGCHGHGPGNDGGVGRSCGVRETSPSRFGHFAKYTRPKIGPAFQCAVPKFAPPGSGGGATGGRDAGEDESGSASNGSCGGSFGHHGIRSASSAAGRGGGRGGGGRRGNRGGARGGRGGHRRGGRGGNRGWEAVSGEGASMAGKSVANRDASAVEIANAAADVLQANYGSLPPVIPRGGLCVHRPHLARGEAAGATIFSGTSSQPSSAGTSNVARATLPFDKSTAVAPRMSGLEDYLIFVRNVVLQTPRPHSEPSIDQIWDAPTARKFKVEGLPSESYERISIRGGRTRTPKRKTAASSLPANGAVAKIQPSLDRAASCLAKVIVDDDASSSRLKSKSKDVECTSHRSGKTPLAWDREEMDLLPLCGLEEDEQAFSYLQGNYHGNLPKAKLSIMVNSDRGYGVQRRRQLKKRRMEANFPDATTFTSESWRWRVHQSRATMLGDFRSNRDPAYDYFDPAPVEKDELFGTHRPWRLRRLGPNYDIAASEEDDRRQPKRPRSFSISWSEEEIEKAKNIWRSILAYTTKVLGKMEVVTIDSSKTSICDLLELVEKAHALPTPEEAFGRRDPSARHMSENMNAIIDAIDNGRDCVARILKCLKDDGEGIELDALRKSIDEIERSCPVGLQELDTVKMQVQEASLWEEKLENNVDHSTVDSDDSDGEGILTEKKLTLEKVERLLSRGNNLTLRPRSLVRLRERMERAHVLRRQISAWNEARGREDPQNLKFVSTLIKQANKIDLAFPELFTLTGVHKKAEGWMDRASIAVRTTVSFEELEELVSVGENLPLNVSDVLEKLQNRIKQAREWMSQLEAIVPRSDNRLIWLGRFREALEDYANSARLVSLLSEGSRIPVTMECSQLLQIEIDARNWMTKAKVWIPQNVEDPLGSGGPQKRGKVDDVRDHLDRASSLRDRLWFDEKEGSEWILDGETELTQMIEMAHTWFKKYDDVINHDTRRRGKLRLPMSKLQAIVEEVSKIPLNLSTPASKLSKMFSQASDWMNKHYALVKRCGIDCAYVHAGADLAPDALAMPLKIDDLSAAVADADSDVAVDLEEVTKMREHLEIAKNWLAHVDKVAPNKDLRKKAKQERSKVSMKEISDLLEQSQAVIVDITDELERLKLEHSAMISWRLQAQQTLKEMASAFNYFRSERAELCAGASELTDPVSTETSSDSKALVNVAVSVSMTTRNINSRRGALSSAGTMGSDTPLRLENSAKYLFPLVSGFLKSVKLASTLTPECSAADELGEVMSWLTKSLKLMNSPAEIYDRRNFSKLDKLIENGQQLKSSDNIRSENTEEWKLLDNLRKNWVAAVKDDIERLSELRNQRDKFVEWCEKADGIISSTDKKLSIDILKELEEQSANFPSTSEVVLRVRKRAKDSLAWVASVAEIIKTGKKIPLEDAKAMTDSAEKLNVSCPEYKTLRAALRATRGWILRVKKCGAANGQGEVAANLVTELINEHNTFLVSAPESYAELKQVLCGYCVCRNPYEGFMIGCDGCEEWYHGPCVGISQEQAQKFDKYVCVRCSTLRVYKDNAASVAGILRKWSSAKGLSKARSNDSQRYGRKVRSAERDIAKAKSELGKHERELNSVPGAAPTAPPQAEYLVNTHMGQDASVASDGNSRSAAKALRDKIGKSHATIGNCEKRLEGYKIELAERKNLEAKEDKLCHHLKKWCTMVKQEVFSPSTKEDAELSRPLSDGSMSPRMDKAQALAEKLGIANLPDIDAVLNSFKIFSWCLHSLGVLMRKPRVDEIRSLLAHSDSGYFKLPEAKCVRMLRSMSSRAQIWQSKVKKALMPVPGEKKPYDLAILRELLFSAKQIPLIMPEETRLWSTIEDGGNRHCICGGPGDGSFMLGCDNCDRWFHGSCMKIDKETGDALQKWICPPCSNSTSAESVKTMENSTAAAASSKKLQAQEAASSQLVQPVVLPQQDISPHAPNPIFLWPPYGLRSSRDAVEALGKEGESDNEDFKVPTQPVAKVKPDKKFQAKICVPQVATTNSAPSVPQVPICQPIASMASVSPRQNHSATVASSAARSASQVTLCQPVARVKSISSVYRQSYQPQVASTPNLSSPSISQPSSHPRCHSQIASTTSSASPGISRPHSRISYHSQIASTARLASSSVSRPHAPPYRPQITSKISSRSSISRANIHHDHGGITQTSHRITYANNGPTGRSQPMTLNVCNQTIGSSQMPLTQPPAGMNALSSTIPYATSAAVHHSSNHRQTVTNSVTAMGLNGPNLSAAVANMDRYVLTSGEQHAAAVPGTGQINHANVQPYTTTAVPHTNPKAP